MKMKFFLPVILFLMLLNFGGMILPIAAQYDPPPPPKPTPKPTLPPLKISPPETLVGNMMIPNISARNLIFDAPKNMVFVFPSDSQEPKHQKYFEDFEVKTNGKSTRIDETVFYEVFNPRNESLLKIEVVTSYYDDYFSKVAIDEKPTGIPIEKLLELDYLAETKNKDSHTTVKYFAPNKLKTDKNAGQESDYPDREFNVRGIYRMRDSEDDKSRFVLSWHTYKLFNNKARKIQFTVSGKKSEIEVAEKILNSIAFIKKTNLEFSSESFKKVTINEFGIGGLKIPENMIAEPVKERKQKNDKIEWTTYDYVWTTPNSKNYYDLPLKFRISTTNYNAGFEKLFPEFPLKEPITDFLVQLDDKLNSNTNKERDDDPVKNSKILELSGVKGSFVLFRLSENKFVSSWNTYRLLDGKAQIIYVSVEGIPSEIFKAEKIIKSLEFTAETSAIN